MTCPKAHEPRARRRRPARPLFSSIDEPLFGRDERLPAFHQLDLRVDKRFTYKRVMVNVYLDIINVYNRQNGEAWSYSYNYQQRQLQTGLPIVPSLGVRLEF